METDPTRMCQILVDLPEVDVLGVEPAVSGSPLVVHVSCQADWQRDCPACGTRGWVKQRPVVRLTDLPVFGTPTVLAWHKIRRSCPNAGCLTGSWTTSDQRIASPRSTVTQRAGRWLTEQVGRYRRAVSAVAQELGCDWHTVNDTVIGYGQQLVDDPDRIGQVHAIGMDETLFHRHGTYRKQRWATTFADVSGHRLLDITEGRDTESVIGWLEQRPQSWLEAITVGTLDMACSYRSIYRQILPQATLVVDPFHLVKHANQCLDRVRCAIQNQTLGHRGHKHDPLYRSRRLLTKAADVSTTTVTPSCVDCSLLVTPTGTWPPPGQPRKQSGPSTPNQPKPPPTTCRPYRRTCAARIATHESAGWAEPYVTGPPRSWPGTPPPPATDPPKAKTT